MSDNQQWRVDEYGRTVATASGGLVAVGFERDDDRASVLRRVAALPDMARVLLDYFRNGDSPERRVKALEALEKAGVIP